MIAIEQKKLKQVLEALKNLPGFLSDIDRAIEVCDEALAQPEQEPVAWMHEWEDGERVPQLNPSDDRLNDRPKSVRPLVYGDTTPPKRPWVGLTDEEIRSMWKESWVLDTVKQWVEIIEAKLKEKNT